jgi:hypothetical protein
MNSQRISSLDDVVRQRLALKAKPDKPYSHCDTPFRQFPKLGQSAFFGAFSKIEMAFFVFDAAGVPPTWLMQ